MDIFFGIAVYLFGIIFFLGLFVVLLMLVAPATFIKSVIEFDGWREKKRGWERHNHSEGVTENRPYSAFERANELAAQELDSFEESVKELRAELAKDRDLEEPKN